MFHFLKFQTECARNLLFRGADKTLKNNANHDAAEVAAVAGNTILENMIRSEQEVGRHDEACWFQYP